MWKVPIFQEMIALWKYYFVNNSGSGDPESVPTETNPSNNVTNQQPLLTAANPVNDIMEDTYVPFKKVCMHVDILCIADTMLVAKILFNTLNNYDNRSQHSKLMHF